MAKKKKRGKASFQRPSTQDGGNTAPPAPTEPRSQPAIPHPLPRVPHVTNITDLTNLTFEELREFNLDDTQQHNLIGQIRSDLPIIDVHEIDKLLLDSLAKQLRLCIFPTAQMMHIDPFAVKRMLDTEFRKAYGQEVERNIRVQEGQHERQGSTEPA